MPIYNFVEKKAHLISRIFDPIILLPILLPIFLIELNVPMSDLILLMMIEIALPIFSVFVLIVLGFTDIDITSIQSRIVLLSITLISILAGYFLSKSIGNPMLVSFQSLLFIYASLFFILTLYVKISGHVFVNTLFGGLLSTFFGYPVFILTMFVVPCVAISRLKLKKHTSDEILGGFLAALICILTFFYFQG